MYPGYSWRPLRPLFGGSEAEVSCRPFVTFHATEVQNYINQHAVILVSRTIAGYDTENNRRPRSGPRGGKMDRLLSRLSEFGLIQFTKNWFSNRTGNIFFSWKGLRASITEHPSDIINIDIFFTGEIKCALALNLASRNSCITNHFKKNILIIRRCFTITHFASKHSTKYYFWTLMKLEYKRMNFCSLLDIYFPLFVIFVLSQKSFCRTRLAQCHRNQSSGGMPRNHNSRGCLINAMSITPTVASWAPLFIIILSLSRRESPLEMFPTGPDLQSV